MGRGSLIEGRQFPEDNQAKFIPDIPAHRESLLYCAARRLLPAVLGVRGEMR